MALHYAIITIIMTKSKMATLFSACINSHFSKLIVPPSDVDEVSANSGIIRKKFISKRTKAIRRIISRDVLCMRIPKLINIIKVVSI